MSPPDRPSQQMADKITKINLLPQTMNQTMPPQGIKRIGRTIMCLLDLGFSRSHLCLLGFILAMFFFSLLCQFILLSSSRNLFAVCLFFRFLRVPTLAILKPLLCRSVWPRTDRDQPASASASQALGLKLFAKSPARQEFQSTKNIFIKFGINRNITSIC